MSNPFDRLRKRREEEEEEEQRRRREIEEDNKQQAQLAREKRNKAGRQYHDVVRPVLEHLLQAACPNCTLRERLELGEPSWSIGRWYRRPTWDDWTDEWNSEIWVGIEFDSLNNPVGFVCIKGKKVSRAEMVETALIQALNELH